MLFQSFAGLAAGLPATSGLRHDGVQTSYSAIAERAERLATGFLDRGIGPGAAVVLLIPNSPDLFAAAYALFAIGAIAVPLSPAAHPRELAWAAKACAAAAVIARDDLEVLGTQLIAELGIPAPLILTSSFERIARTPPATLPPVAGDATAIYLFSSGSTGRPKVVPHTHAEMLAEGSAVSTAAGWTADDVILNSLPGHHGFGFMSVHFEAASVGATTVYWSNPQPLLLSRSRFLRTLEAERVTVLPGVPFAFDTLCGASDVVDLQHLRAAYAGGVSLKRPIYERFRERFGLPLGQAYGSTESGQVAYHAGADGDDAWQSVGPAYPGSSVEIVPDDNAPDGVSGELVIRGPSLSRGYLGADAQSNAAFRDGGFYTGDLGYLDGSGNIVVTGRSKLILEVSGYKIDPVEIEDVAALHPGVAEAIVVGIPDPRSGEQRLKLVAVLKGEVRDDELIRFCRARLSAHKVPSVVEFRDAIPKSATGKILRGQLIGAS